MFQVIPHSTILVISWIDNPLIDKLLCIYVERIEPFAAWLVPGVGVAMMMLSLLLSSYYSVVMAWAMLYLGSSFTYDLPWTHCNNTWNTENCVEGPFERVWSVFTGFLISFSFETWLFFCFCRTSQNQRNRTKLEWWNQRHQPDLLHA